MKNVLVLGAGMVARPLVRYLLERGFRLVQADIDPARAEAMIDDHPNGRAVPLDMSDAAALAALVQEADLTVSLVPPQFHPVAARACVAAGKPMVTASYVSDAMQELDAAARDKGVLLLNEIGVDPGIDHMSAMRLIDMVRGREGRVLLFQSYCGGLPAPEAVDNPLGYKFSWAPRGVLTAARNDAQYLRHHVHVHVPWRRLFRDMHMVGCGGVADFEAYPNRDSLAYREIYGLQHVATMYRGTLRYPGWCDCLHNFVRLGLLDLRPRYLGRTTCAGYLRHLLGVSGGNHLPEAVARRLGVARDSLPVWALEWLGLTSDEPVEASPLAPLDFLSQRMQAKLAYRPGERDMIVLKHELIAEYPDRSRELLTSRMVEFGYPDGDTAMARTVSLPVAIAARLILEGKIERTGVARPITPDIYLPVLAELEELGIVCQEEIETMEPGLGREGDV